VLELLWGHEALHREVIPGGLKVLPEGEYLTAHLEQIEKSLAELFGGFPQPQHEP
jgi:hypothetical protein